MKQLNAIQNLGAIDVLCTDKTGILTMDQVILERHCDVMQRENEEVLRDAYLIAHFQTGLKNVLDRAVLNNRDAREDFIAGFQKVNEISFDSALTAMETATTGRMVFTTMHSRNATGPLLRFAVSA